MNEKIAKKVGEAHAFAAVLNKTFTDHSAVMGELFGTHAEGITNTAIEQQKGLEAVATAAGMDEVVTTKSGKTGEKITKMGEMYVGDDWDDVAEVLEWMSFFIGGAVIHWQLIVGAAKEMDNSDFQTTAEAGAEYYHTLLHQLKDYAEQVGKDRVNA
ncbi:MAG: hypothetical protein AAGA35_00620 [Patescibacteria group bacterium]